MPILNDRHKWADKPANLTMGELLEYQNAIQDLREKVAQLSDEQGAQNAVLAEHEAALTRHDDDIRRSHIEVIPFGRQSDPAAPTPIRTIADEAVDPHLIELDRALRLMIDGALIACRSGMTGEALRQYVSIAVLTAETRVENEAQLKRATS